MFLKTAFVLFQMALINAQKAPWCATVPEFKHQYIPECGGGYGPKSVKAEEWCDEAPKESIRYIVECGGSDIASCDNLPSNVTKYISECTGEPGWCATVPEYEKYIKLCGGTEIFVAETKSTQKAPWCATVPEFKHQYIPECGGGYGPKSVDTELWCDEAHKESIRYIAECGGSDTAWCDDLPSNVTKYINACTDEPGWCATVPEYEKYIKLCGGTEIFEAETKSTGKAPWCATVPEYKHQYIPECGGGYYGPKAVEAEEWCDEAPEESIRYIVECGGSSTAWCDNLPSNVTKYIDECTGEPGWCATVTEVEQYIEFCGGTEIFVADTKSSGESIGATVIMKWIPVLLSIYYLA